MKQCLPMGYPTKKSYGLWGMGGFRIFPVYQLGGRQNPWVIVDYGLPQVWVRTSLTVPPPASLARVASAISHIDELNSRIRVRDPIDDIAVRFVTDVAKTTIC